MADDNNGTPSADSGVDAKPRRKRGRPANPAGRIDGGESGNSGNEGGNIETAGNTEAPGGNTEAPGGNPEAPGTVNPESLAGAETPKKKRGRPPGSGTAKPRAEAKASDDLSPRELATEIAGAYWMLSQITQQPVFDIGVDRAMMIAKPLSDVQAYYPIKTNGPALSIAKLIGGIVAVNLPIVVYLGAMRKQAQAQQKRATQPATPDVIIPGATETKTRQYDFTAASQPN